MALQGKMPLGEGVFRVSPVDGRLAVNLDGDVAPYRRYLLSEPLRRLVRCGVHHRDLFLVLGEAAGRIEAAGADRIAVRRIDLSLIARWETAGELCPKVLP